jgi:hypothetical protein
MGILNDYLEQKALASNIAKSISEQKDLELDDIYYCQYCKAEYLRYMYKCENCGGVVKIKLQTTNRYENSGPTISPIVKLKPSFTRIVILYIAVILIVVIVMYGFFQILQ